MPGKHLLVTLLIPLIGLGLAGCTAQPADTQVEGEVPMNLILTSSAFQEGQTIPVKYACDGQNVSPPLAWSEVPAGTISPALIVDDPDAPGGAFVHWVLYDLPGDATALGEGTSVGVQGVNGFRKSGYGGPCPPKGSTHRYYFKLYALDKALGLKPGASKADVEKAIQGHILTWGQIMGKYGR
jgi:Raf kinase inhibitor-like YbhB/YbcL family protein